MSAVKLVHSSAEISKIFTEEPIDADENFGNILLSGLTERLLRSSAEAETKLREARNALIGAARRLYRLSR